MDLSENRTLVYVLRHSGCVGYLKSGRVERNCAGGVDVYDDYGQRNDYLSKDRLRSWCVRDGHKEEIAGWSSVAPEDAARIVEADF